MRKFKEYTRFNKEFINREFINRGLNFGSAFQNKFILFMNPYYVLSAFVAFLAVIAALIFFFPKFFAYLFGITLLTFAVMATLVLRKVYKFHQQAKEHFDKLKGSAFMVHQVPAGQTSNLEDLIMDMEIAAYEDEQDEYSVDAEYSEAGKEDGVDVEQSDQVDQALSKVLSKSGDKKITWH